MTEPKQGASAPPNTGNAGKGRPAGVPNKLTAKVREAIETAFSQVGGADYLARVAIEDPKTFCALLGKLLPMQVSGEDGGPVRTAIEMRIVDPRG